MRPSEIPLEDRAAIAICQVGPGQRHLGLAYRPNTGTALRLLHLAWHRDLREEPQIRDKYRCVILADVPRALHPTIVAQCKRSVEADLNDGLPYGFGYTSAVVSRDDATGRLRIDGASGLTCATFVLAILQLSQIQLVDVASWLDRDGDDDWKEWVIDALEQNGASAEHVEAVRADRNWIRIRPEDVAGAATHQPIPASFSIASARAVEILRELFA